MLSRRKFLISSMGAAALALAPVLPKLPADPGRYLAKPFPEGWTIIKEEMADPRFGEIGQRMAKALARSMMQTREIVARNVLTKTFPDEYTYKTYGLAQIVERIDE